MISPELIRRFPFFAALDESQLKEIAMISDIYTAIQGEIIFTEYTTAEYLIVLLEGDIELFYTNNDEIFPTTHHKEVTAGIIEPGEVFSISCLIDPYQLSTSARARQVSRMIKINGQALRALLDRDTVMGYTVMRELTKVLMERLEYTRVQLAAAWA